jgi:endonuclease/exonuclease/phosphatase family metal-dependent hydrolase
MNGPSDPRSAKRGAVDIRPRDATLRIVAYNFLSGGSRKRAGHWSRIRRRLAPDIVLAQECRTPEDSPAERFRCAEGDTLLWAPVRAGRWGSAIWLRGLRATPLEVPGFGGWVVGAEVAGPPWSRGRALRIFSVHCPVGERGYVRTMHAILDGVGRLRGEADLILGGDFNVVVGSRQPGERIRVNGGERALLDRLAAEFDLISCWQAANPGRRLAQTLRWSAEPTAPYHCDGIFVPSAWGARLASCRVVTGCRWKRLSDHNPVLADFTAGSRPSGPLTPSPGSGAAAPGARTRSRDSEGSR